MPPKIKRTPWWILWFSALNKIACLLLLNHLKMREAVRTIPSIKEWTASPRTSWTSIKSIQSVTLARQMQQTQLSRCSPRTQTTHCSSEEETTAKIIRTWIRAHKSMLNMELYSRMRCLQEPRRTLARLIYLWTIPTSHHWFMLVKPPKILHRIVKRKSKRIVEIVRPQEHNRINHFKPVLVVTKTNQTSLWNELLRQDKIWRIWT